MGEVWKARDARLDRVVAIKRLKPEHAARCEREACGCRAESPAHLPDSRYRVRLPGARIRRRTTAGGRWRPRTPCGLPSRSRGRLKPPTSAASCHCSRRIRFIRFDCSMMNLYICTALHRTQAVAERSSPYFRTRRWSCVRDNPSRRAALVLLPAQSCRTLAIVVRSTTPRSVVS